MNESWTFDYESMILWNKVLTDDKSMVTTAFAYTSRAKLFFEYKLYQNAFKNIVMAEANSMSSCFVNDFKIKCETNFANEVVHNDESATLELSYKANDRVPYIVNCLKICSDVEMKPYIITDRNLMIGNVICKEKALFAISHGRDHPLIDQELIEADVAHQRCHHCFKHNNLDLLPCPGCDTGEFTSFS